MNRTGRHTRMVEALALLTLLWVIGLLLLAAYVVGEDNRCARLRHDNSPLATTYCPPSEGTP